LHLFDNGGQGCDCVFDETEPGRVVEVGTQHLLRGGGESVCVGAKVFRLRVC
jgi:hypothetical protein